ncbi:hypothetical protein BM221_002264 [Beauveria bassiana]|uniref:Uncharacterized protein n=1 Tax=Beauveria bassiana TaxID=176275 RepID=A0A2N6NY16_BEABA|nr:hypothetical protein BM221_002264 [Beauveria bassiana]
MAKNDAAGRRCQIWDPVCPGVNCSFSRDAGFEVETMQNAVGTSSTRFDKGETRIDASQV